MNDKIVRCPTCDSAYKVYGMYAGDQSACPVCRRAAEEAARQGAPHPTVKRPRRIKLAWSAR